MQTTTASQPQQPKPDQPRPQTRREREEERLMLTKHLHPPVVNVFRTSTGRLVRF
ncbi:MAG TPA: hypothetical protein VF546_05430 [Pyrinomonadaceae bacterium]|jgi:hypothetical protein